MKKVVLMLIASIFLSYAPATVWGVAALPNRYAVIAWNDLGMHCMDRDYSVFSLLPPYNNLHAQLVDRLTGKLVSSRTALTYEATADTNASINTTSYAKTNFWDWVLPIYGSNPAPDIGLLGNPVQSGTPAAMTYASGQSYWKAEGIPTVPYDDNGNTNCYPMVSVVSKDLKGRSMASTKTVLPVSDEMNCSFCHSSGVGDPAAMPSPDWVYDSNPDKDWRRNILLLHDNRNAANQVYADALAGNGYNSAGLLVTSDSGNPILCANCHASNALSKPGFAGVKQLTTAVHTWHGQYAMDDSTGMPLDLTTDRSACYYCHPGSTTQCLRGVMGKAVDPATGDLLLQCQSCHGIMSKVGADGRRGWIDLPSCQNCHYLSDSTGSYVRDTSVFDSSGNFRQVTSIFSTGAGLYKLSAGHKAVQCEACHGSTHAEYPTSEPNDNVQSTLLQGYQGTVRECSACHLASIPLTGNKGPHGLHTIGQLWVFAHARDAKRNPQYCTTCHGNDYKGTFLSKIVTDRKFYTLGAKKKIYSQGDLVSCYDCHKNVPNGR
ncbi:MAG TPA: multiheme c-type cytochrome [Thermodesulfovibrionales bacterium]|nr:multiheme c-type cytochrome [Thermodesulfovibrionales bacterium]